MGARRTFKMQMGGQCAICTSRLLDCHDHAATAFSLRHLCEVFATAPPHSELACVLASLHLDTSGELDPGRFALERTAAQLLACLGRHATNGGGRAPTPLSAVREQLALTIEASLGCAKLLSVPQNHCCPPCIMGYLSSAQKSRFELHLSHLLARELICALGSGLQSVGCIRSRLPGLLQQVPSTCLRASWDGEADACFTSSACFVRALLAGCISLAALRARLELHGAAPCWPWSNPRFQG